MRQFGSAKAAGWAIPAWTFWYKTEGDKNVYCPNRDCRDYQLTGFHAEFVFLVPTGLAEEARGVLDGIDDPE